MGLGLHEAEEMALFRQARNSTFTADKVRERLGMGILERLWNKASKDAERLTIEKPAPVALLAPPDAEDVKNFKKLGPNKQLAVAKQYGHYYNKCIYCGRWLNDPRSKKNGYGLRCAEIRGLPWE